MTKRPHFAALIFLIAAGSARADEIKIDIAEYLYKPGTVSVPVGTKVTWVNHDEVPHTVADRDKRFRSGALDTDETYAFTFTEAGTFQYFCTLHPTMVATLTVTQK